MLILRTFHPGDGEPSYSPYCLKAMCLLEMSGLDWRPNWESMPRGPYKKLPALETPEGVLGDSNLILSWLERKGAPLFPGFDPEARAMAHMTIRTVENSLGFSLTLARWVDEAGWPETREKIFGGMPGPLRAVLPGYFRSKIRKGLVWHGIARFDDTALRAWIDADLDALDALLGGRDWLFGARPSAADCTAVPMLSLLSLLPAETVPGRAIRARASLIDYVRRGRAALYPDLSSSLPAAA